MALTPEEELELRQLEEEQSSLYGEFNSLKNELIKSKETIPKEESTSMIEAGFRGAAQGATFGMADELTARAESFLTGKPYEQALQESRAEYKVGEEEYPITSALGEVAGGVGQAVGLTALTGGAAAPAAGAGAIGRLAKLGQMAKNVLVPTTSASALTNIRTAATTGAVMGGLTGIGKSEKEGVESLKDAPYEALAGGIAGGVLGGAVEGIGSIGKKVIPSITKAIEEKKLPEFARQIVFGGKKGLQGETFISERSKDTARKQVVETAKEVINTLDDELSDAREVRNFIINNSSSRFKVDDILENLRTELSKITDVDADPILQTLNFKIKATMKTPKNGVPQLLNAQGIPIRSSQEISPRQAYDIVTSIRQETGKKDIDGRIRDALKTAINEIKDRTNSSIDEQEIQNILTSNDNILNSYNRLKSDTIDDLVDASGNVIQQGTKNLPTLKMLDTKQAKILSSAEAMGVNPSEVNLEDILADQKKLSQLFFSLTKGDTQTGVLGEANFEAAMERLAEGSPKLAQLIKEKIDPVIKVNEYLRFTGNMGAGPRTSDTSGGIIGKTIGEIGKYGAQGTNIATYLASRQPVKTLLRPTVATLNKFKTSLDQQVMANPNSKTLQMFSGMVKNALDQKDESRRAAILNTLMQYKSFRELFKEGEE